MKWNLRLVAATRGIWKASELQQMLAERDVVFSAGKMSGLWSSESQISIKTADLEVLCAVLECGVQDLLVYEADKVPQPVKTNQEAEVRASGDSDKPTRLRPRRSGKRSLPPE